MHKKVYSRRLLRCCMFFLISWTTDAGTSSANISSEYSCTWWRTGQKHFHLPCPNVRKFHCAALMCWPTATCQYGVLALLLSSMFSLRVRHARSIVCVWANSDLVWFASVSTLLYHSRSDWLCNCMVTQDPRMAWACEQHSAGPRGGFRVLPKRR